MATILRENILQFNSLVKVVTGLQQHLLHGGVTSRNSCFSSRAVKYILAGSRCPGPPRSCRTGGRRRCRTCAPQSWRLRQQVVGGALVAFLEPPGALRQRASSLPPGIPACLVASASRPAAAALQAVHLHLREVVRGRVQDGHHAVLEAQDRVDGGCRCSAAQPPGKSTPWMGRWAPLASWRRRSPHRGLGEVRPPPRPACCCC